MRRSAADAVSNTSWVTSFASSREGAGRRTKRQTDPYWRRQAASLCSSNHDLNRDPRANVTEISTFGTPK
jgi:hypothetical protein